MIDLNAFIFVFAGTLTATMLQAGIGDCRRCIANLLSLFRPGFSQQDTKASLARHINDIAQNGLIRSEPSKTGDTEIDDATDALIADRSIAALVTRYEQHRKTRLKESELACNVLYQASDLAPIMGLAGTLISLAGMAVSEGASTAIGTTIGLAVITTFYGVLLAQIVFLPMAGIVNRRARAEDKAREDLFHWLRTELVSAEPKALHRSSDPQPDQPHWLVTGSDTPQYIAMGRLS